MRLFVPASLKPRRTAGDGRQERGQTCVAPLPAQLLDCFVLFAWSLDMASKNNRRLAKELTEIKSQGCPVGMLLRVS